MKKISIVTGGSSGLGEAIVKELAKNGENVCIVARDKEKINRVVESINVLTGKILSYSGDISDEKFVVGVFDRLASMGYYVDFLYNCAGVGLAGNPEIMNENKIRQVFDSNTVGLMIITYETCRRMVNGGTIVNIMSSSALKGNGIESVYCASKWAVRGFTESLKAYYKNSDIRIIGVYPGGMDTPFWSGQPERKQAITNFMDADEVAKVIIFNASAKKTLTVGDITIERKPN